MPGRDTQDTPPSEAVGDLPAAPNKPTDIEHHDERSLGEHVSDARDEFADGFERMRGTIGPFKGA
jgi:hypothetical protein